MSPSWRCPLLELQELEGKPHPPDTFPINPSGEGAQCMHGSSSTSLLRRGLRSAAYRAQYASQRRTCWGLSSAYWASPLCRDRIKKSLQRGDEGVADWQAHCTFQHTISCYIADPSIEPDKNSAGLCTLKPPCRSCTLLYKDDEVLGKWSA